MPPGAEWVDVAGWHREKVFEQVLEGLSMGWWDDAEDSADEMLVGEGEQGARAVVDSGEGEEQTLPLVREDSIMVPESHNKPARTPTMNNTTTDGTVVASSTGDPTTLVVSSHGNLPQPTQRRKKTSSIIDCAIARRSSTES